MTTCKYIQLMLVIFALLCFHERGWGSAELLHQPGGGSSGQSNPSGGAEQDDLTDPNNPENEAALADIRKNLKEINEKLDDHDLTDRELKEIREKISELGERAKTLGKDLPPNIDKRMKAIEERNKIKKEISAMLKENKADSVRAEEARARYEKIKEHLSTEDQKSMEEKFADLGKHQSNILYQQTLEMFGRAQDSLNRVGSGVGAPTLGDQVAGALSAIGSSLASSFSGSTGSSSGPRISNLSSSDGGGAHSNGSGPSESGASESSAPPPPASVGQTSSPPTSSPPPSSVGSRSQIPSSPSTPPSPGPQTTFNSGSSTPAPSGSSGGGAPGGSGGAFSAAAGNSRPSSGSSNPTNHAENSKANGLLASPGALQGAVSGTETGTSGIEPGKAPPGTGKNDPLNGAKPGTNGTPLFPGAPKLYAQNTPINGNGITLPELGKSGGPTNNGSQTNYFEDPGNASKLSAGKNESTEGYSGRNSYKNSRLSTNVNGIGEPTGTFKKVPAASSPENNTFTQDPSPGTSNSIGGDNKNSNTKKSAVAYGSGPSENLATSGIEIAQPNPNKPQPSTLGLATTTPKPKELSDAEIQALVRKDTPVTTFDPVPKVAANKVKSDLSVAIGGDTAVASSPPQDPIQAGAISSRPNLNYRGPASLAEAQTQAPQAKSETPPTSRGLFKTLNSVVNTGIENFKWNIKSLGKLLSLN